MNRKFLTLMMAAPMAALLIAAPADARKHRRTHVAQKADPGHGNCLRFNKTTGAITGAVAGGLLGRAIDNGGSTGTLVGAGVGGLAGHTLARDGRKRC